MSGRTSTATGISRFKTRSTPSGRAPSAPVHPATRFSGQPLSNPNTSNDEVGAATLHNLFLKEVVADGARHEDTLNFVEYTLAATNSHLQSRAEGKKVTVIPSVLKKAMGIPETRH